MRNRSSRLSLIAILLLLAGLPIYAAGQAVSVPSFPDNSTGSTSDVNESGRSADGAETASSVQNSIVKVFATTRRPNLFQPWRKQSARDVTGTGFIIEGRRILTNAHVVFYASLVEIQGNQASDKLSASVEYIAPGIDLAVLKLEDESFFETHPPLPRSNVLPKVRDSVLVYGYPVGGDNLSITKGIVSRIDFTGYNYNVAGLRVQIDAAINPGNSGGPALVDGHVIGVAFSLLANSQNIGYIIPCEEIDLFLDDIADGSYEGKPVMLDELQTLENPALREYLKLDRSIEGLVVHAPFDTDSDYPLLKWDVITKIGDVPIDNQGNILLDNDSKISFSYLVQKIKNTDTIDLTIIRKGEETSIQLPLMRQRSRLLPHLLGAYPSYFIFGPVVFSAASEDLVATLMGSSGSSRTSDTLSFTGNPLIARRNDKPAFEGEELVIIPAPLFAHTLAKGYGHPTMRVVDTINDIKVKNLRHLVEIIRDSDDEFITIETVGFAGESLVFHREKMIRATEDILNDGGIRNLASPDILEIWQQ